MNFNIIQAAEVKLWDFSAYFWNTPRIRSFEKDKLPPYILNIMYDILMKLNKV